MSLQETKLAGSSMSPSQITFPLAAENRAAVKLVPRLLVVMSITLSLSVSDRMEAAVINASSVSLSAVQAAVNSASAGDTVQVPAGSATWTGTLTINKDIQLIGAGIDQTTIIDGGSPALTLISWTTVANGFPRLSGFTFAGNNNPAAYNGSIVIGGTCSAFRLDHCKFNLLDNANISVDNAVYGVIDHCNFIETWGNGISVDNGSPSDPYGDVSWATPVQWGSTNFLYIESNTFYYNTYPYPGVNDMLAGARVVFRFNCVTNLFFQDHGTESGQRYRGGRAYEIYGNTFVNNTAYAGYGNPIYLRSGTGLIFSNTFNGFADFYMGNFRASGYFAPWGSANGLNPWDSNNPSVLATGTASAASSGTGVLTDSSANWKANQWVGGYEIQNVTKGGTNTGAYSLIIANDAHTITTAPSDGGVYMSWNSGDTYRIYQCYRQLDQVGSGSGDLITGSTPVNTTTGTPLFPHEGAQPLYAWNNIYLNSSSVPNTLNYQIPAMQYNIIMRGRDYTNSVAPNYVPLVFPHPLVSGISPQPSNPVLTVVNGTGGGSYPAGSVVSIAASTIPTESFTNWSGLYIADTNSANTTVTMPSTNLTVTANYTPSPPTQLKVMAGL